MEKCRCFCFGAYGSDFISEIKNGILSVCIH